MKPEKTEAEPIESPSHVAVIRLGRVAGKVKYTLLDAADLKFIKVLMIQAKLEVDPNGHGASVYAWAGDVGSGGLSGKYLHNILWEIHFGAIPSGFKVVHKNGITMDNRTENLSVMRLEDRIASCEPYCCCHGRTGVPTTRLAAITNDFQTSVPAFHAATKQIDKNVTMENGNSNVSDMEKTLYYLAIQQISVDPLMEMAVSDAFSNRFFDGNMDLVCDGSSLLFYECHFPPCVNMEKELQQYSLCGRCRQARYCSLACQQKDWGRHKKLCVEKPAKSVLEVSEYEMTPIH